MLFVLNLINDDFYLCMRAEPSHSWSHKYGRATPRKTTKTLQSQLLEANSLGHKML